MYWKCCVPSTASPFITFNLVTWSSPINSKTQNDFAKQNSYQSFASHISDLFQIEASFIFQLHNLTFNILLHVPLVKPEFLLSLHQYIPFPLPQDFSANHSLTPSVGNADILAFGDMNTFKIVSQSDFTTCHQLGNTYFSREGMFCRPEWKKHV